MKVAFIIPSLANKGPIIVVQNLILGLVQKGVDCHVYYFDSIFELKMDCPLTQIKFRESINMDEYDIVHSHGLRPDIYVFLHRKNNYKTKYLTTLHAYLEEDLNYQYNKLVSVVISRMWLFLLNRFDNIVVLSKDAVFYYYSKINNKKLRIVYNTRLIDQNKILPENIANKLSLIKNEYKIIGINALLTPRKGVDMLIKCLIDLPNCFLVIVGDGKSKDDLISLATSINVIDRCLFLGYQVDAYRFLPYYDVYAMTSRSEGFGLVVLEAALYKIPVVCSELPIFKELYSTDDVTFFELENLESLRNAIEYSLNNRSIGETLFETYQQKYSLDIFTNNYLEVYKE